MNFGSGTDPIEGSKLAISILDYFYNLGCLSICTTHYQELKEYVLVTSGFENASFEFNLSTLTPTYKLLLGIPGKSNAFEISKRLGLKDSILEKANSMMDSKDIHIEDLLKEIYDNKLQIEKEKEDISKNLNQVQMLRKKLEVDYSDAESKALLLVENAKKEARDILLNVKDEASQIIKQMNSLKQKNSPQDLYNLKNDINNKIKDFTIKNTNSKNGNLNINDINIGLNVYVIPLGKNGIITKLPNASSQVEIQVGSLKTNVNINQLVKLNSNTVHSNKEHFGNKVTLPYMSKSKNISPEINVIGLTVDDAIPLIDKYLDDAKISKLEQIRIVHGKGTGKLRTGIHSFLKKHPHVKSFRIGTYGEGEMGATIVILS